MQCAESLRVQAYFDRELDALSAAEMERHSEACAECRELLADLHRIRAAVRQDMPYECAPPALRARIAHALEQENGFDSPPLEGSPPASGSSPLDDGRIHRRLTDGRFAPARLRPFWAGACSGIFGTAVAGGIAFLLMTPPTTNPLLDDLVSAHVRSLLPDHLIDVRSTDKHTVKPWFAGHTDVSPVVADFEAQGYRLIGGRADYFAHQRAAVVVYQHGPHVINVFSWAADQHGVPKDSTRNGYHFAFWQTGNLLYCAVSDTAWDELMGLVRLLQNAGNGEPRETSTDTE